MCFSAEASFAASGVLAASSIAIARLPKARSGVPLSLFPAVFATHQFIEGTIWLQKDLEFPAALRSGTVYAYVFIAYILWPLVVPFSTYLLEAERRRRILILLCQAIGLGVSLTLFLGLFGHPPTVSVDCCRLSYDVAAPDMLIVPYLAATCLPFLASSRKGLVLFGVVVSLSCAAAAILASASTFPSVWCFFAAVLSGSLYLYFRKEAGAPSYFFGSSARTRVAAS